MNALSSHLDAPLHDDPDAILSATPLYIGPSHRTADAVIADIFLGLAVWSPLGTLAQRTFDPPLSAVMGR